MKKFSLLFVLIFSLPFFIAGCTGKSEEKYNTYTLSCEYDEISHTLDGTESVEFYNKYDNSLSELKFFLYPNSFDEGKEAVSTSYFERAYPSGEESYGNIEIESVKSGNENLTFNISDEGNILTVTLLKEIYPNEKVCVDIDFTVNLANINHRLGYGDNTVNFGNFYPILCVYENGFVENDFATNGDPFYSETANYDVTLTFGKDFVLASSGDVLSESESGENKVVEIEARRENMLGYKVIKKAFVIGAGNLGVALSKYSKFSEFGLEIECLFDSDNEKIGKIIDGKEIFDIALLKDKVKNTGINIAILTTPNKVAQTVCNYLVESGIKYIWNFAPSILIVPKNVKVWHENIIGSFIQFCAIENIK